RYYCDYCDKHLANNASQRKSHLCSAGHAKLKANHYAKFRQPDEILLTDSGKKPCRNYFNTGQCQFGQLCKFSHLTDVERYKLVDQAAKLKAQQDPVQLLCQAQAAFDKWRNELQSSSNPDFVASGANEPANAK
ncbi:hypothetical protein BOX15_Mlig012943g1, partial [Macrostomum lignano]